MKIDEALYQIKQRIKMHELEGTTSNENEREKTLLDYITNLQARDKYFCERMEKYCLEEKELLNKNIKLENKITNLQKERNNLKTSLDESSEIVGELEKENNILKENAEHNDKVVDKVKWNEMIYKGRIEKAIEYIEENEFYLDYKTGACIKGVMPLLDILKGEDK